MNFDNFDASECKVDMVYDSIVSEYSLFERYIAL